MFFQSGPLGYCIVSGVFQGVERLTFSRSGLHRERRWLAQSCSQALPMTLEGRPTIARFRAGDRPYDPQKPATGVMLVLCGGPLFQCQRICDSFLKFASRLLKSWGACSNTFRHFPSHGACKSLILVSRPCVSRSTAFSAVLELTLASAALATLAALALRTKLKLSARTCSWNTRSSCRATGLHMLATCVLTLSRESLKSHGISSSRIAVRFCLGFLFLKSTSRAGRGRPQRVAGKRQVLIYLEDGL